HHPPYERGLDQTWRPFNHQAGRGIEPQTSPMASTKLPRRPRSPTANVSPGPSCLTSPAGMLNPNVSSCTLPGFVQTTLTNATRWMSMKNSVLNRISFTSRDFVQAAWSNAPPGDSPIISPWLKLGPTVNP